MSNKKDTTILAVLDSTSQSVSGWNMAIADAEAMIKEEKNQIAKLRRSIDAFRVFRDNGTPFPSENLKQREAKS